VKLRLVAGYGAIVCALPYLTLKVIWLSGGQLGVANADQMRSLAALNAVTAAMGLVGIASALAFTHTWGLRVPAWLVLPPVWIATGLLVRFVLAAPLAALGRVLSGRATPLAPGEPVQPWVYALVYTEFVGLGLGLATAFALHARARWPSLFRSGDAPQPGPTRRVQVPLANTAAALAVTLGALLVARAFYASPLINLVDGATMIAAGFGMLAMVHPFGRHLPPWAPAVLTWIGSGFLFGWGLWGLINVLGHSPLVRDAGGSALLNFFGLTQLVAGLVMGLVMLFVLSERLAVSRESPSSEPARLSGT
jgi:hypothetical protein